MKIILIGAGNLATNLGRALKGAGHEVAQVYSRTTESARRLAELLGCAWTTRIANVARGADLYIVAVKDSVLADVARKLTEGRPERFVVHTAGSMPMEVIPVERRGVLYPMQTFSKDRVVDFRVIPCFVETARAEDMPLLQQVAESVSDSVYEADSEQRKYLHLSAVFCCNFANHCCALSEILLEKYGHLPFSVMQPLIDETARKLHELSPRKAQTGPAVRWDTNVMDMQMELLKDEGMRKVYEVMSESIRGCAERNPDLRNHGITAAVLKH